MFILPSLCEKGKLSDTSTSQGHCPRANNSTVPTFGRRAGQERCRRGVCRADSRGLTESTQSRGGGGGRRPLAGHRRAAGKGGDSRGPLNLCGGFTNLGGRQAHQEGLLNAVARPHDPAPDAAGLHVARERARVTRLPATLMPWVRGLRFGKLCRAIWLPS